MENDVNYKTKPDEENSQVKFDSALHPLHPLHDYSTIVEKSLVITYNTRPFDLYKGFIYMFLSCFFKSLFSILCKLELERNENLTSFHLLSIKAYFMLGISLFIGLYGFFVSNINIYVFSRSNLNLILLRAILSIFSISLTIFALKYISISEVYTVFYIYPGIVILLSFFILKEKVGRFDYLCLLFCFIGVLLIIRPHFLFPDHKHAKSNLLIFGLVIIGASLKAFEDIIIRNVGTEIDCLIVPSIYAVVAFVLYPLPLIVFQEYTNIVPDLDLIDLIYITFISVFSFVYQALMTLAIQSENAGRVAMINYLQIFFMFLSDLFIFYKKIVFLDVLGTFIILFFNFANGLIKVLKRGHELNSFKYKQNEEKHIY
jgi:drug/metabolite transporter (DMT)-like permease